MSSTAVLEYKRIFVESSKCNGCRICELRCSFSHYDLFSPVLARIRIHKDEFEGIDKPVVCRQCAKPPCIEACPQNAISKHETLGYIMVNEDLCDGCGLCVDACPFGAITLHVDTGHALICDTCGGNPQCVEYCPENALHFMTPNEYREYKKKTRLQTS